MFLLRALKGFALIGGGRADGGRRLIDATIENFMKKTNDIIVCWGNLQSVSTNWLSKSTIWQ